MTRRQFLAAVPPVGQRAREAQKARPQNVNHFNRAIRRLYQQASRPQTQEHRRRTMANLRALMRLKEAKP